MSDDLESWGFYVGTMSVNPCTLSLYKGRDGWRVRWNPECGDCVMVCEDASEENAVEKFFDVFAIDIAREHRLTYEEQVKFGLRDDFRRAGFDARMDMAMKRGHIWSRIEGHELHSLDALRMWYDRLGLGPDIDSGFAIGHLYVDGPVFGVFRDGDEFVMYRVTKDGKYMERYRGDSEAYPVGQLHYEIISAIYNGNLLPLYMQYNFGIIDYM